MGKEEHLNYFLYRNKWILEDSIGLQIISIEIEKHIRNDMGRRKVDMYAQSYTMNVIGEVQLNEADDIHFKEVVFNIEHIKCGIIFWIAKDFSEEILKKVIDKIKGKDIIFYALKINCEVLELFQTLDRSKLKYEIIKGGVLKEVKRILEVIAVIKDDCRSGIYIKMREEKLIEIHHSIKELISEDYCVNYSKKIEGKNYIIIGAGVGDASFRISIKRNNKINIALIFSAHKKEIFRKINENKEKIMKEITCNIEFNQKWTKISVNEVDYKKAAEIFVTFYTYFKEKLVKYID